MHYYQFNIGDYKSHTDHLDLLEDLAFRRMMDWCYLHESPLPLDLNVIAKKILMRTHTDSIASVLEEFFHKTEDGYLNKRINSEVEAFKAKSDKARKSAEARWSKKKPQSEGNANALQPQSEGNAKHKPLNTKHEPVVKDNSSLQKIEDSPVCFQLLLNDNSLFDVTEAQCTKWANLYPAVNIDTELRKMIGWLDANPTKRKTRKGVLRFANNWISKVQDKGGSESNRRSEIIDPSQPDDWTQKIGDTL